HIDSSLLSSIVPVLSITNQTRYDLWDNVIYDILVKENKYIREACLRLIVTLNFIDNYQTFLAVDPQDEEQVEAERIALRRLAHGRSEERRVGKECRARWES